MPPKKPNASIPDILVLLGLEFAIQQITGFHHARQGNGITSLVEAMGLLADEWMEIKERVPWLPQSEKDEVDEYFKEEGLNYD